MTSKWNSDTTIKFIELYKNNACLWNVELPDYKTRSARETAYENLMTSMNIPNFTVQEVKNKIKNLRSTYCQEMKRKAEYERAGGSVYNPSLRWLKHMEPIFAFRVNHEDSMKAEENSSLIVERKKQKIISKKPISRTSHKRRISEVCDEGRQEAFDAFGKSVVMQLKNLSEERALLAQSHIQSLLTEYGVADLKDKQQCQEENASFTFVSSKDPPPLSPSSNCSNDDAESVVSNPESKYFDRYPDELLNTSYEN